MKKMVIITVIIVFALLIITAILYAAYTSTIDTEYAKKYSEVFGSYEIGQVDKFLDTNTTLSFQEETQTYAELRPNVTKAFDEKRYSMEQKSSYGHGDDNLVNGIQKVEVSTFVDYKDKVSEEISMEIERKGLFSYRVKSLKCDGEFFGYLFFGIDG